MKRLLDFWDEKSKFVFASSVIAMIITHGFCFLHLMYSHDSLSFYDTSGVAKVTLGRWLYPAFVHFRQIAAPWMMGVLSIFYISLAVVFVTKILGFNKIQGMCVAMLFSTSVALTSLFCTYIFDADADCMALLLACFAVYSFIYFPKFINIIVSVVSLVLCLALYQAYICVSLGLFVTVIICKSKDIDGWKGVLNAFIIGIKELITVIIAVILYVPIMHIMANHYGVALSTGYNGAGQLSSLTFDIIWEAIPKAYAYFRDSFFEVTAYNTVAMVKVYGIMLLILFISIAVYIWISRPFWGALVLIVPCVLLMPLALNAIYLVSFGTMHQLMIYAFPLVLLLPLVFSNITAEQLADKLKWGKPLKLFVSAIAASSIFFISFNNVIYANGAYVYKKLVYDNTALHAQSIWKDINNIDGYVEGETQVIFMGEFRSSKAAYVSSVGDRYNDVLTGAYNSSITYQGTAGVYYYGILGRGLNVTYDDPDIQQNEEYINMPAYPSVGYCKIIDNKVVVKLN